MLIPLQAKKFNDVSPSHWAKEGIDTLAKEKIMNGYPNGNFNGNGSVNRYQMAAVVGSAYKKLDTEIEKDRSDLASLLEIMELFQDEMAEVKKQLKKNQEILVELKSSQKTNISTHSEQQDRVAVTPSLASAKEGVTVSKAEEVYDPAKDPNMVAKEITINPNWYKFWKKPYQKTIYITKEQAAKEAAQAQAELVRKAQEAQAKAAAAARAAQIELKSLEEQQSKLKTKIEETNNSRTQTIKETPKTKVETTKPTNPYLNNVEKIATDEENIEKVERGSFDASNGTTVPTSKLDMAKYQKTGSRSSSARSKLADPKYKKNLTDYSLESEF